VKDKKLIKEMENIKKLKIIYNSLFIRCIVSSNILKLTMVIEEDFIKENISNIINTNDNKI